MSGIKSFVKQNPVMCVALLAAAAAALCEENGQRAAAHALELLGVVEVILAAQPILADLFGFAEKMLLN